MTTVPTDKSVIIKGLDNFSPELIFGCGQCFRWRETDDGWLGVARGQALRIKALPDGNIELFCTLNQYKNIWHDYFDMSCDYGAVRNSVANCEYMRAAVDYGTGIRILRQEFWEALCSFIISQCNNITRISGIVESLCALFGSRIDYEGISLYTFPTPSDLALLSADKLAPIKSGYRAEYILTAARVIDSGELDPRELTLLPTDEARRRLMSIRGVGEKVANCVLLFGLYKTDAFPVDVWMKRALKEHFPPGFDPKSFGGYAGIAQQYIFHYARTANL